MIRLLTTGVTVAVLLGAVALADPVNKEHPIYFPTKVGDKWVKRYERTVDGRKTIEKSTYFVSSVKDQNGAKEVIVSSIESVEGKTKEVPVGTFLVSDKGVFFTQVSVEVSLTC
ncbi:hypothetical protein [Fimbriiglobus ruber]|uniref:Uncharacterized protein n=1 Tax=Fimbriiglobus ruber TaxID=1908690 RepID=A0A225DKH4_9BACT|nr:hypothetical protein [Fimbriiglobus ruber]OWK41990.1 hypothetical protein FRUB_04068 [Fimbriiglobus ruber]